MLRGQGLGRLQFNDQLTLHHQVCQIITNQGSILVKNLDGMLLLYIQPRLPQPMSKRVLVNFLQVAMPMINMTCFLCVLCG